MTTGFVLVALSSLIIASNATDAHRTIPIFNLLKKQGFSRPLGPDTTVRHLGALADSNRRYEVWYYNHLTQAAQVKHGRQSVILVEDGTRYAGAYEANMASCYVKRNAVLCRDGGDTPSFRLLHGRPPQRVLIGGHVSEFFK